MSFVGGGIHDSQDTFGSKAPLGATNRGYNEMMEVSTEHGHPASHDTSASTLPQDDSLISKERTFSTRAIIAGILIGAAICLANLYFGLQAGLNNSMPLPSALLGFIVFQPLSKYLRTPYSPMENVLVMTIAASMGGMPVTAGLDGIIPALEYFVTSVDNGPLKFSLWRLIVWSSGVCLFGIVFAAPLRNYFVIRAPLRFPTGTAMAMVIGLLHGRQDVTKRIGQDRSREPEVLGVKSGKRSPSIDEREGSSSRNDRVALENNEYHQDGGEVLDHGATHQISVVHRLELIIAFGISGLFALVFYFVPGLQKIPIFGIPAARDWAWAINPSPAWVGYGMIMRPVVSAHMLLGAIIGWGILSPVAKSKGWAPGPADQWQNGSQGWIIWVALGVLLGDSLVGIGWIIIRPFLREFSQAKPLAKLVGRILGTGRPADSIYGPPRDSTTSRREPGNADEHDALLALSDGNNTTSETLSQNNFLSTRAILCWLVGITLFCCLTMWYLFGHLLSIFQVLLAIVVIPPLGMASIRAMGETDNSLASSLGKVSQFLFAFIIPGSNRSAVVISLLVGGIAEGGIYQSSDVMQHFKTGYLVGASPKDLFYGQVIGSSVGAVLASCVYKLYTSVYTIPDEQFRVPQAQLWLATANLVYGRGLPEGVWPFVVVAFALSASCAVARIAFDDWRWKDQIPSGIAVGIGLYILPVYTLPRALGGFVSWYCKSRLQVEDLHVLTIASGLILGQGVFSIANLLLELLHVSHF